MSQHSENYPTVYQHRDGDDTLLLANCPVKYRDGDDSFLMRRRTPKGTKDDPIYIDEDYADNQKVTAVSKRKTSIRRVIPAMQLTSFPIKKRKEICDVESNNKSAKKIKVAPLDEGSDKSTNDEPVIYARPHSPPWKLNFKWDSDAEEGDSDSDDEEIEWSDSDRGLDSDVGDGYEDSSELETFVGSGEDRVLEQWV